MVGKVFGILFGVITIGLGLFWYCALPIIGFEEFSSSSGKERLFLKSVGWGIGGGHDLYVLSKTKRRGKEFDPDRDLWIQDSGSIYYRHSGDTLYIRPTAGIKGKGAFTGEFTVSLVDDLSLNEILERTNLGIEQWKSSEEIKRSKLFY
jgi:hypothetical protein